jgi:proteasome lid subunit RPN8/RPN11
MNSTKELSVESQTTLVLPAHVYADICEVVSRTKDGCETGVWLFGVAVRDHRVVLAIAGPGPRATHEPVHYSADNDYASEVYNALRSALPSIEWLGELHVHPRGMPWLSQGDRRTVREILEGAAADTIRPHEFIAGAMQRRSREVDIYPYYFGSATDGRTMPMERVPTDAEIVRSARLAAAEDRRPALPQNKPVSQKETPRCQGWFQKVVSMLRRKDT